MRKSLTLVASVIAIAAAVPAFSSAQTAGQGTSGGRASAGAGSYSGGGYNRPYYSGFDRYGFNNFEANLFREQLDRIALSPVTAEREDRAIRLAALIDAGRCGEAVQLAAAENDRQMRRNARRVCRGRGVGF